MDPAREESFIGILQSQQPFSSTIIITALINEISNLEDDSTLILDDYHAIDNKEIDSALS